MEREFSQVRSCCHTMSLEMGEKEKKEEKKEEEKEKKEEEIEEKEEGEEKCYD